jgi:Spy/CpxP family protein refolding chaperone
MNELNEPSVPMEQDKHNEPVVKRSKRKYVIGALLVVFIIAGTIGVTIANNVDKYRKHGPMGFISDRIIKELNLNDQQKKEVEKIRDEIKAKMDERKKNRRGDREQMELMFRSDNFDKQKALELAKKHDTEKEEMRSFFIDEVAKFHSILTSEQRNKAADKMKEMREKKGKFFKDGKRNRD